MLLILSFLNRRTMRFNDSSVKYVLTLLSLVVYGVGGGVYKFVLAETKTHHFVTSLAKSPVLIQEESIIFHGKDNLT
jgi:hypothetical protein